MCAIIYTVKATPPTLLIVSLSMQATAANSELDHALARKLSQRTLWLNIAAVISFIVVVIAGVLLGAVLAFTLRNNNYQL